MHKSEPIIQQLQSRRSIGAKFLEVPVPEISQYLDAVKIALCQPDHKKLHPCRVVLIEDTAKLGLLFKQGALALGATIEEANKAQSKATKAPATLAFIAKIDETNPEVPIHEQWMTCGAFASSVLTSLELMGFGGKIVSGSSTTYPEVNQALCTSSERIIAWLMLGTPKVAENTPTERPDPQNYFSIWS